MDLDGEFVSTSSHSVPIIADDEIIKVENGGALPPSNWASRCLYIGETGARNWLNVARQPSYTLHGQAQYDLRKNRLTAVQRANARTMVSLGPGDGEHDIEIVHALQVKEERLKYIPVDISSHLLDITIEKFSTKLKIPVGVLCDFENGQRFLHDILKTFASPPVLFSLLGGTIGNLDLGERHFFYELKKLMQIGDFFLVDVPLAGPAWKAQADPRLRKDGYNDQFRHFLAGSIVRWDTQASEEGVLREFDERVALSVTYNGAVDKTKTVTVSDTRTHRTLLQFRRYDWQSLTHWLLKQGFDVKFAKCSIASEEDKFGMGVLLLSVCKVDQGR